MIFLVCIAFECVWVMADHNHFKKKLAKKFFINKILIKIV